MTTIIESEAEGRDTLARAMREAPWGLIIAGWTLIIGFDLVRQIVNAYLDGRSPRLIWLVLSLTSNVLWALLTPLMLWLGRRVPFERRRLARAIAIHAGALVAITLIDAALQVPMYRFVPISSPPSLAAVFVAQFLLDFTCYVALVAMGHAQRLRALYHERVRAQAALDEELARARLRALEMQLQPHFLFNTLHAVGSLVRGARNDDAVRCLATLGALLRATLDGDGHEHALADELAFARGYLELQQIRFADRLRVAIEIEPDAEPARVPRLILQPLLENAVRHGVERSRTPVQVEVRARVVDQRLELVVRDRGGARGAAAPGHGVGLANTRARLAALYGAAHAFELTPTDGGGLAIRIELPLRASGAARPVLQEAFA